ncbi:MAG: ABC transporter ATP-binding protein [Candidatus Woesearchaeota archaeon]
MKLEIQNLSLHFGKQKVLDNLTLTINKGEIWGIVGANGTGKTSLFSCLQGIYKHYDGIITYTPYNKKYISNIPQRATLPDNMDVLRFLQMMGTLKGLSHYQATKQAMSFLHELAIDYAVHHQLKHLSNGLQMAVNIIQAFMGDPHIVFLDEPNSGLDPKMSSLLKRFLQDHKQEKTYIISSHNLAFIEEMCSHVAILHGGKLIYKDVLSKATQQDNVYNIKSNLPLSKTIDHLKKCKHISMVLADPYTNIIYIESTQDISHDLFTHIPQLIYYQKGITLKNMYLRLIR